MLINQIYLIRLTGVSGIVGTKEYEIVLAVLYLVPVFSRRGYGIKCIDVELSLLHKPVVADRYAT